MFIALNFEDIGTEQNFGLWKNRTLRFSISTSENM
jgi:hypothetical protein